MDIDIPMDANVQCADEVCGKSAYLVIDPVKQKATHLIVREAAPPHARRIVPVESIAETSPGLIQLKCTREEFAQQPPFVETEYIKADPRDMPAGPPYAGLSTMYGHYVWPFVVPSAQQYVAVKHEHIPVGELAVRRGAHVVASDGRVGRVDEFLVDPQTEHITHLVLREGHLWGQKDVMIPVSEIDYIEENTVYVKLDKHAIGALPAIPVRRWGF